MNNDYVNKIAKVAQERFEEAKNLILQEMQVALAKADECSDNEESLAKIIADFIGLTTADEEEYCVDRDCEECRANYCGCEDCIEDEIEWINQEAIDFEKDYYEIGILLQKDDKGEWNTALEFDKEIERAELPALMSKAIVGSLYDENVSKVFTKDEVSAEVGGAMIEAVLNLLAGGIKKIIEE